MPGALEERLPAEATAGPDRCIACGGELDVPRRYGAVELAACADCGSRTAVPRPTPVDVAELHDSEEYFGKTYFEARRGQRLAAERRFRRLLRLLPSTGFGGRRLLDIGCDTGELAAAAARIAQLEPYGVDVAARPLDAARAAGVEVFHGELAAAPASFDDFALVTAIDVVEHTADPVAFLASARERLATDGVVYLETPNWDSLVYRIGSLLARAPRANASGALVRLFPPEHVQYFTSRGLTRVAERAGFRPVEVLTRDLEATALAGGMALRIAMWILQIPDRLSRRGILLCALLAPEDDSA
jgi:2-polyprenyl-3-methyl-5-hydroxy-6-metoxy-1,4-benzoquinol methylase